MPIALWSCISRTQGAARPSWWFSLSCERLVLSDPHTLTAFGHISSSLGLLATPWVDLISCFFSDAVAQDTPFQPCIESPCAVDASGTPKDFLAVKIEIYIAFPYLATTVGPPSLWDIDHLVSAARIMEPNSVLTFVR